MKVRELIEQLKKLDWDKEILLYTDWNYLQENDCYFKYSYTFNDIHTNRWYFLKTKDEVFVEELICNEEVWDILESINIAKKYMKREWYGDIEDEWECYYLEVF